MSSHTMLLVGTRKRCFVLESNGDRADWRIRGPYCDVAMTVFAGACRRP